MEFWRKRKAAKLTQSELRRSREDYGLKILAVGETATIDLIAVHGLNGHRERTWKAPNGVNWLRDLLPKDIPNSRVLTYGYNARTHGSDHLTAQFLYEHSLTFLERLNTFRKSTKTEKRPIIFIAHSLGGILVKSALIHANLSSSDLHSVRLSTYGVAFFGTPHAGSPSAVWATGLLRIGSLFAQTNTAIIKHLQANSEWLRMQLDQFGQISADLALIFCYESYKTPLLLRRSVLIVPRHSATLAGYPSGISLSLAKNHTELVRYESDVDEDYRLVISHLKTLVANAGSAVAMKWDEARTKDEPAKDQESPMASALNIRLDYAPVVEKNQDFLGRVALLENIHECLFPSSTQGHPTSRVVVLYGLGGIGKTQLSLQYAEQHKALFSAVLWVDGSSVRNTQMSLRGIAQRYLNAVRQRGDEGLQHKLLAKLPLGEHLSSLGQLSSDEADLPVISEAVVRFLTSESDSGTQPLLMIVDNMDELLDYPLSKFVPRGSQSKVIITSRLTAAAHFGEPLEVDHIEKETAVAILLNNARLRVTTPLDNQHAETITEALGCLPLAIEQSGAFISQAQIRLDEYMPLFEKNQRQLLGSFRPMASRTSTFVTLELSFQQLQKIDNSASELLSLLAFFHFGSVWEGLLLLPFAETKFDDGYVPILSSGLDDHAWLTHLGQDAVLLKAAFGKIMSVSLAKRGVQPGSIYLHPLVHSWARNRLDTDSLAQKRTHALVVIGQALETIYRQSAANSNSWDLQLRIRPHLDAWLNLLKPSEKTEVFDTMMQNQAATVAMYYVGAFLQDLGRPKEAEDIFQAILRSKAPDKRPDLIPNTKRRIAQTMQLYSRYEESEVLLWESKDSLTALVGACHPDTLATQVALGHSYHRRHKYEDAERVLREVIQKDEEDSGAIGRHGREAASTLGLVYRFRGLLKEAVELLNRALDHAVADDSDTLGALNLKYRRAIVLQELGNWGDAEAAYTDVLQARKHLLGNEHPLVLRTTNALGRIRCFMGRYKESRQLLETAWNGQEKLGFSKDGETAQLRTLFNLGVLDREEGLYNEAFERLNRAYHSQLRLYGPDTYSTLEYQMDFAILLGERGDLEDAESLLRSNLDVHLKKYPDSIMPHVQKSTALAEVLAQLGRFSEAQEVLAPAIAAARANLEPVNPRRLMLEVCVAHLDASSPGPASEALQEMPAMITRLRLVFGNNHPITIRAKAIHAELLFKTGNRQRAEILAQEASNELGEVLGSTHPKVVRLVELAVSMSDDHEDEEEFGGEAST